MQSLFVFSRVNIATLISYLEKEMEMLERQNKTRAARNTTSSRTVVSPAAELWVTYSRTEKFVCFLKFVLAGNFHTSQKETNLKCRTAEKSS